MSGIPKFTGQENLRRIKRQKKVNFIVVEGVDDIPIYQNLFNSLYENEVDFDIVHSDGKENISVFLMANPKVKNCYFITDRDFDDFNFLADNVTSLRRYSIENYFLTSEVIASTVSIALKIRMQDVNAVIDLNHFIESTSPLLTKLFHAVYYYQHYITKENNYNNIGSVSWSDTFICMDKSWNICSEKVEGLINKLYPDGYNEDLAVGYYSDNFISSGMVIYDCPGKMLKVPLQRYLMQKAKDYNASFGKRFHDTETTCMLLTSHLNRSVELRGIISGAYNYLKN